MSTEISLAGLIPNELYQTVLNRLTNHTHSISRFVVHEIAFDRGPLEQPSEDSNMLRLKHTVRVPEPPQQSNAPARNPWTLVSMGRIEPERLSAEFTIRPLYQCPIIEGDALEFVSALGYRRQSGHCRRGVQLVRGGVVVEIFQVYESDAAPAPVDAPHLHLITVAATVPSAPRAAGPNPPPLLDLRADACARVREIAAALKGLADLGRVDPL